MYYTFKYGVLAVLHVSTYTSSACRLLQLRILYNCSYAPVVGQPPTEAILYVNNITTKVINP